MYLHRPATEAVQRDDTLMTETCSQSYAKQKAQGQLKNQEQGGCM